MATKKYYWLKLKNDFFTNKKIKKLRKIAGGDTYTIIYLKMQLLSIKDSGKLFFENVEDSFAEELALELDEDVENVKVTLIFLIKNGLLVEVNPEEFILPETVECIGSESSSAERVRKHRELQKQKMLQCNAPVTKSNTEIEKEKDIDLDKEKEKNKEKEVKHKYGEYQNVKLTEKEYNSLKSEYGSSTDEIITYLDEYIEMKGAKYKSCYLAIRKWVAKAVLEKKNTNRSNNIRQEIKPDWLGKEFKEEEPMTEEEFEEARKLQERLKKYYGKRGD